MECLCAAASAGLATLDLSEKEWTVQHMVRCGEYHRKAANLLHGRIEIELRVTPVMTTRHGPFVGWKIARLECGMQRLDPMYGNNAAQ